MWSFDVRTTSLERGDMTDNAAALHQIPGFQLLCWDPDDALGPPPIISTTLGSLLRELNLGVVVDDAAGQWGRINPDDIDAYIAWATTGRRDGAVVNFWRMPQGSEVFSGNQQPCIADASRKRECYLISARLSHGFILVTVEFYDWARTKREPPVELNVDDLREKLRKYRLLPSQQPWWRKAARRFTK